MEPAGSTTYPQQHYGYGFSAADGDGATRDRLEHLLELNAATERDKALFRNDRERVDAFLMKSPIDSRKAFALFGLIIGALPPISVAAKFLAEGGQLLPAQIIFIVLLAAASGVTGLVGYTTGRLIPGFVARAREYALPNRIALYCLIGWIWGGISGAAGGLLLYVFGAILTGIVGSLVGAGTVPLMIVLHESLRRGDLIEMKHFLPVALGITLSLCAFVLGF